MTDKEYYERREARKATRKILWRWGNTINDINRLELERKSYKRWADDARDTLHAQNVDGMPRGSGGNHSDLANVIENIIKRADMYDEQVKRIDAEIADRIRLRNTISELISKLTSAQETIISYRYIDGHSFQYIAMKTNYDIRTVQRIESDAVDIISKSILVSFAA